MRWVLVVWTVLVLAAGLWWWTRGDGPAPTPVEASVVYALRIDTNRPDRIDVEARLVGLGGRVRLATVDRLDGARATDGSGRTVALTTTRHEIAFDAPVDGVCTLHYGVPVGGIARATLASLNTPYGGLAPIVRLVARPISHRVPLKVVATLPTGWRLHRADGMRADGLLDDEAFRRGVLAWTHSASHGLVSRPHDVAVTFVGRTGVNDPLLAAVRALVERMISEVIAVDEEIAHRLLVFDLPAPHLRLAVEPQRHWSAVEHGPVCRHRVVRIARGLVGPFLAETSKTPTGDDAVWYPSVLEHYAPARLAQATGVLPQPAWRGAWSDLRDDLLRAWSTGRDARPLGAAGWLADLQATHPNAQSVRLLRIPARSASRLTFERALGDQIDMPPRDVVAACATLRERPYLMHDSLFRQALPYEALRPPAGAVEQADLRLLVSSELHAEVEGCGGCPTPGTLAQWTARSRALATAAPTIRVDAGDWSPFVFDRTDAAVDVERAHLMRRVASIAGVDALVVGPNEVAAGAAWLRARLAESAGPPLLAANVAVGDAGPAPFVVVERGGHRVALVGLADFPRRRYRLSWYEEALIDVTVDDPVRRAAEAAAEARAAGADLVVAVGALDPLNARQIAAAGAVDAVYSAAPAFGRPPRDGDGAFTDTDTSGFRGAVPVIYGSGARGSATRVDLRLAAGDGRVRVVDFTTAAIHFDDAAPDPDVQRLAEAYRASNAR